MTGHRRLRDPAAADAPAAGTVGSVGIGPLSGMATRTPAKPAEHRTAHV
jgi:hypothetical protein